MEENFLRCSPWRCRFQSKRPKSSRVEWSTSWFPWHIHVCPQHLQFQRALLAKNNNFFGPVMNAYKKSGQLSPLLLAKMNDGSWKPSLFQARSAIVRINVCCFLFRQRKHLFFSRMVCVIARLPRVAALQISSSPFLDGDWAFVSFSTRKGHMDASRRIHINPNKLSYQFFKPISIDVWFSRLLPSLFTYTR